MEEEICPMKILKIEWLQSLPRYFFKLLLTNAIAQRIGRVKIHRYPIGQVLAGIIASSYPLLATAQLNVSDLNSGGLTPQDIVNELLGDGGDVTVSNVSVAGDPRCIGTFTGGNGLGSGVLGFDSGVILGSGQVTDAVGPNTSDVTTGEFFTSGDAFLNSLVPGEQTFDACFIEFDFECNGGGTISVDYVMGSEEYNEVVGERANDVFGFALNGGNISTIPASGGLAVSVSNLNCGNPYDPFAPVSPNLPFCDLFINNDLEDGGGSINIEADGLTKVLTAQGNLLNGINHIKFAVGDVVDETLDTWVYLKGGSFQCHPSQEPQQRTLLSTTCTAFQNGDIFSNEDVIQFNEDTGLFEKLFDGSDVGLFYSNVDAFSKSASGDLLISLDQEFFVAGAGYVGDEDILRFVPTSLGDQTEGTFELFFNGSQNGLGGYGVDIDAFHIDEGVASGNGNDDDGDGILNEADACPLDAQNDIDGDGLCGNFLLYFSLTSSAYIGGFWFADEDIILFREDTGSFSIYFNGSSVGLSYADVDAIKLQDDGSILMSFDYPIVLSGLGMVNAEDVVRFIPTSLGQATSGSFELFLDGSEAGLQGYYLNVNAVGQTAE